MYGLLSTFGVRNGGVGLGVGGAAPAGALATRRTGARESSLGREEGGVSGTASGCIIPWARRNS